MFLRGARLDSLSGYNLYCLTYFMDW